MNLSYPFSLRSRLSDGIEHLVKLFDRFSVKIKTSFLFFTTLIIMMSLISIVVLGQQNQDLRTKADEVAGNIANSNIDLNASLPIAPPIHKKVYVLIYDPILSNGQRLSVSQGWTPYLEQAQQAIDFFDEVSEGHVSFSIEYVEEIDAWPVKIDGFQYNEETYLDVLNGVTEHHEPDILDYYQFLNDTNLGICDKFNAGEIDEIWTFAGPWFGFYESTLAGSQDGLIGFAYNDDGYTLNLTSCTNLIPIGIPGAHTFGHRMEATMKQAYGSWEENRMDHNWDSFGLEKAHSPDYSVFGCGSVHYAPNSRTGNDDYDFDIPDTVSSYCDSFFNYPDLGDLPSQGVPVSCSTWGCTREGYEKWWFGHIPKFSGVGPDRKLNDWWEYLLNPNLIAFNPNSPGKFSNLSATFDYPSDAVFNFSYNGQPSSYVINLSTYPDMSNDVYVYFAMGNQSPITETNPTKWGKYSCGKTLYWQVNSLYTNNYSSIQSTTVDCPLVTKLSATNQTLTSAEPTGNQKQLYVSPDGKILYSRFYIDGSWQTWDMVFVANQGIENLEAIRSFSQSTAPSGIKKQDLLSIDGTTIWQRSYVNGAWGSWSASLVSSFGANITKAAAFHQTAGDIATNNRPKQTIVSANGKTLYTRFYQNGSWLPWTSTNVSSIGITGVNSIRSFNQTINPQGLPKQEVLTVDGKKIYVRTFQNGSWDSWQLVTVSTIGITGPTGDLLPLP